MTKTLGGIFGIIKGLLKVCNCNCYLYKKVIYFYFIFEIGSSFVAQAGLEFMAVWFQCPEVRD